MTSESVTTRSGGASRLIAHQSLDARTQQGEFGFIPAAILFAVVLLMLKVPDTGRDVLFLAGGWVCFSIALGSFSGVWTVFLLLLPIVHIVGSMFGFPQMSFTRIFVVGLALLAFLSKKGITFGKNSLKNLGFLAFILFILANLISAIRLLQSEAVFRSMAYLEPALYFVLTYYVVGKDPANLQRVLRMIVIGGIFVGILGFIEMITQQPLFDLLGISVTGLREDFGEYLALDRFGLGGRIVSTIGQPVYTGAYFAIWLIVSVYYIVVYMPKHRNLLFILIPFGVLLMLSTGSLGPLFALAPTALAFVVFNPRKSRAAVIVGIGVALAVIIAYIFLPRVPRYFQATFSTTLDTPESANLRGRIELTSALFKVFQQNPVFGYGPGLIQKSAQREVVEFAGLGGLENQYATILADGGLLAGLAYLLFMWGVFRSLLRIRRSTIREVRYGGLLALLIFTFYFVFAAGANCLTLLPNMLVLVIYGAVASLHDGQSGKKQQGAE